MQLVADILHFPQLRYHPHIVASIRHPGHVVEATKLGAHIATNPFSVYLS
jgi:transaldolase